MGDKPVVAVIARFWNSGDLVFDWMENVVKWADHIFAMDAGSTDGTWANLSSFASKHCLNFPGELYRLPPSAPMLSGFYAGLLLRMLDDVQPDLVVHLDHDEFLEPEIAEWFPKMHADAEHDAWDIARRNFAFGKTHYEGTSAVMRFRERFCYRWFPNLRHPSPMPNGRARQQGIHHLERVPLGHPARDDTELVVVKGVPNYQPRLNDRLGHMPDGGPWMLHYCFRDEARNRVQYDRLKSGAHEVCANFLTPEAELNCPLIEYVPYSERQRGATT